MKVDAEADSLLKKYGTKVLHGPRCSVETSGSRALIEALSARGINAVRVMDILGKEKGIRVPSTSIQRHRRKVCSCHL